MARKNKREKIRSRLVKTEEGVDFGPGTVAEKINGAMKSTKKIVANMNKALIKDPAKQATEEIHAALNPDVKRRSGDPGIPKK